MPHWSLPRPGGSALLMIRVAEEFGVSASRSLHGARTTIAELEDPACEIEGRQELTVLRNIMVALGPQVPFGLIAGLRYHPTTHGDWGFALLSSPNIGAAIELGQRYFDLSYSFNRTGAEVVGTQCILSYDGSDNPEDVRAALIERDMAALLTLWRDINGIALEVQSLEISGPPPDYADAFAPMFGVKPKFHATENRISFDASILARPQPQADAFGLKFSEAQCRALLDKRSLRSGVAGRVRARVLRKPSEFPRMSVVAKELAVTTRTLRNQLSREGTSYRKLVEQMRVELAEDLLCSTRASLDEIAEKLGYADKATFIAAFKRWRGVPPGEFRTEHRTLARANS